MQTHSIQIVKMRDGATTTVADQLAVEEPLEIRLVHGKDENRTEQAISVTMRTPGHDTELAIGFLVTEGILASRADFDKVAQTSPERVTVHMRQSAQLDLQKLQRNFYATSSCGVCGKSAIEAIKTVHRPALQVEEEVHLVAVSVLQSLPEVLRMHQPVFDQTGGLHASALFNTNGQFIALREDVGRHNALDKLIGAAWLARELPWQERILLLSGRASFELIQKAAAAGVSLVVAVGAPSSLAAQAAHDFGITLVGFLRSDRLNIYTHPKRIAL